MEDLLEKIGLRKYWIWPIAIIVAIGLAFCALLFVENPDGRSIITGIIGGFVVWLATFFSQIVTMRRLQHYLDTGLVDLRDNRHDAAYYSNIIANASSYVHVTGSSASRFIDDFLHYEAGNHILLERMRRIGGLSVKLLVPTKAMMDESSVNKFKNVAEVIKKLQAEFPGRFEIKYFNNKPFMSFVLTENDFVGGPILPKVRSQDTSALHVKATTSYAQSHKLFFDELWTSAGDLYGS